MHFNSPLSNLSETLMQIQESAKLYRGTLTKNEAATRAVLIDPILRSLGWNTANTNMVEVEKTMDSVRADYALYDSNSIPRIIVEAKALGTDLDQKKLVMALVGYAFNFGLNDVFLTDGVIWEHFDHFQPGNLLPTRTLNLSKDDPVECAAYFVQHIDAAKYWPVEQSIDALSQRIDELENLVSNLQKNLNNLSQKNPVENERQDILWKEQPGPFTPLEELYELAGKKPSKFLLPSGEIVELNTWKDVLRESCKFALTHNSSFQIPFPDKSGKKVMLFDFQKPAHKVSYVSEQYNGQKIYIYLNYDSNHCVDNAKHVLDQVPVEHKKVSPAVFIKEQIL